MNRSELMARIRSKGNASTELALAGVLRQGKITGWRRQQKVMGISVDFVFAKTKIAVFVDGCFWHACPAHCKLDRLAKFWRDKVVGNARRDILQGHTLREAGWKVIRVWEHSLKGER